MLKKNKKDSIRRYLNPKIMAIFGFILIIGISYPLSKTVSKHYKINKEIKELELEIKNIEDKNNNLNKLMKFIQSDEFADKQARLNLNYKKAGEEVLVIKNKEELASEKNDIITDNSRALDAEYKLNNSSRNSNFGKWLKYFIK